MKYFNQYYYEIYFNSALNERSHTSAPLKLKYYQPLTLLSKSGHPNIGK